jgi:tRNA 2-selenouridine synthase SelU
VLKTFQKYLKKRSHENEIANEIEIVSEIENVLESENVKIEVI